MNGSKTNIDNKNINLANKYWLVLHEIVNIIMVESQMENRDVFSAECVNIFPLIHRLIMQLWRIDLVPPPPNSVPCFSCIRVTLYIILGSYLRPHLSLYFSPFSWPSQPLHSLLSTASLTLPIPHFSTPIPPFHLHHYSIPTLPSSSLLMASGSNHSTLSIWGITTTATTTTDSKNNNDNNYHQKQGGIFSSFIIVFWCFYFCLIFTWKLPGQSDSQSSVLSYITFSANWSVVKVVISFDRILPWFINFSN